MPTETIVTLTMNPAIDKSMEVDKIVPEAKLHCTRVKNDAGGGGINVSKALKELGVDSTAIFPCGGHNGNMLQELLNKKNISCKTISVKDETRENFIVLETSTNKQFRFDTPGAVLNETIAQQFLNTLSSLPVNPSIIIASGSLPEGIHEDFYVDVARIAKKINAKFILDTSGKPLQLAVNENVYLLKPNLSELSKLAGIDSIEINDIKDIAQQIIAKSGCKVIVVSLGPQGAVLVTKDFYEKIPSPNVKKLSTVGAGDSMVAGMVYKLSQGKSLSEILRYGVACGSAATLNSGTELFNIADVEQLYNQLSIA